jgi:hypothetical protein
MLKDFSAVGSIPLYQVWYLRCCVAGALNVEAPAGNNIDVIIWLKNNIL